MRAVALPGRAYPTTRPVLATPIAVLRRRGYDVHEVSWTLDEPPPDPAGFVARHLSAAGAEGCDLVVAKSLGCWAAARAAEQGCPAIWLTPVLTAPAVAAAIRANPAPQLAIGGLGDPMWDGTVARGLGCSLLELPGLDHALSSTGDGVVAADILERMAVAVDDFLEEIA